MGEVHSSSIMKVFLATALLLVALQATTALPQDGQLDDAARADTCADAAHYFDAIQKKLAAMVKSVKGVENEAGTLDHSLSCLPGCEGDFMCSMDCGLEEADAAVESRADTCADAAHYFDAIQKKLAAMVKSVKGVQNEAG